MVSPLKPLEAFASAKAVVLSDVAPHITLGGESGERAVFFRAGSPDSLQRALARLLANPDERRSLGRAGRLWTLSERRWSTVCEEASKAYLDCAPATSSPGAIPLESLRIGIIADEFTSSTISPSVNLIPLERSNWRNQLGGLDLVFIESAWHGNNGQWHRAVGYYSKDEHSDIRDLIVSCRRRGIATVFWNKEDPVHTKRFERTAALCDHIYTVDANLIAHYRSIASSNTRSVSSLSFYAQPLIHNPVSNSESFTVETTAAYAGTYYGNRYKERSRQLDALMASAKEVGLAIYDRQGNDPESPYRFPLEYSNHIRGSLTYSQTLETYKNHLVHLNVNSVVDSPSMFSRRVVEIAASGGIVLSAPARGIQETFGPVMTVHDSQGRTQSLLRGLKGSAGARAVIAWNQLRRVLRSFTAKGALAVIARNAGLDVHFNVIDSYSLETDELNSLGVESILKQSHLPTFVQIASGKESSGHLIARLQNAGIHVLSETPTTEFEHVRWSGRLPNSLLPRTWYEDLLLTAQMGQWSRLVPNRQTFGSGHPLVAAMEEAPEAEGELERSLIHPQMCELPIAGVLMAPEESAVQFSLDEQKPLIDNNYSKRLLIAGHDLKFMPDIIKSVKSLGYEVMYDNWEGHNRHDVDISDERLRQADTVWCEWGLGNAVWYSHHINPHQRLFVRIHLQELSLSYLRHVKVDAVDKFIFVSELMRQTAIANYMLPPDKCVVIPNAVETSRLRQPKLDGAAKRIGFVGMVPQRKRIDIALDLLERIHKHDTNYVLAVKGHTPEAYPWLIEREKEMRYYHEQFERISRINERYPGAVSLEGYSTNMHDWYRTVGHVISTSDFESFHMTIADGAASGALPSILYWDGAEFIYPEDWLYGTVEELAERVLRGGNRECPMEYIASNFDTSSVSAQIERIISE